MSKSMVRIFSSILLVGFLGFLLPINHWHLLSHDHSSKNTTAHSTGLTIKQGVEKCAFCDLQLPLLFHEPSHPEILVKPSFNFLFTDYSCCELPVKDTPISLRGPPLNELV